MCPRCVQDVVGMCLRDVPRVGNIYINKNFLKVGLVWCSPKPPSKPPKIQQVLIYMYLNVIHPKKTNTICFSLLSDQP